MLNSNEIKALTRKIMSILEKDRNKALEEFISTYKPSERYSKIIALQQQIRENINKIIILNENNDLLKEQLNKIMPGKKWDKPFDEIKSDVIEEEFDYKLPSLLEIQDELTIAAITECNPEELMSIVINKFKC